MKRIFLVCLFMLSFFFHLCGQTVVENPKKPKNPKTGRILKLKEVMSITDKGRDDYFFKRPGHLRITADGSLYIKDKEQLLKFSPDGQFIMNLYQKGQGPGEITSHFLFALHHNDVFIWDFMDYHLIHYDSGGRIVEEHHFENAGNMRSVLSLYKDFILFVKPAYLTAEKIKITGKMFDADCEILIFSKSGESRKVLAALPEKRYNFRLKGTAAAGGGTATPLVATPNDDASKIYVSHSEEYMIKVLDVKQGKIVLSFTREYPRVENKFRKKINPRFQMPPLPKYQNDIRDIYFNEGFIWVLTSTQDKNGRYLYDVFDIDGRYLDCFYLQEEPLALVKGKYLFFVEEDADGNIRIVKYENIDPFLYIKGR